MTRVVLAGLLVTAAFAALAVPGAEAAWCSVDYRYIEDAGASVTCTLPVVGEPCYARGPGYWDPVPTVRCVGVEFPPEMAQLCLFTVGADVTAACTTENYVADPVCQATASTTDPANPSAGCA